MSTVNARYFGEVEYSEDAVIRAPEGIPGFPDDTEYLLIQLPAQHPLVYLQSVQTPQLCFQALPVRVAHPGYQLEIGDEDARLLGVAARPAIGREVLCLALLAADNTGGVTANLMAPVVIHISSRMAAQCLNTAGSYACRHPLDEVTAA